MSNLSDATLTVQDGALGISVPSTTLPPLKMGIFPGGTPNVLYSFADSTALQSALGQGTGTESATHTLGVAGGQVLCMPVNPSQFGYAGTVSLLGTGFGTVAVSLAPAVAITVKCVVAGVLGTAQFTFQIGSGPISAPVVSSASAPWTYLVPGTLTVLTFTAGTYVLNSTYVIGTDGTITLGGGAINNVTQQSSPLDNYQVSLLLTVGGSVGTASFKYALTAADAAAGSYSPQIAMPSGGKYAIPNTGIVLTFGQHTIVVTITTPGTLGTAVYSYTVDGGAAVTGNATTPNSGSNYVVTIPGTGVTLTFAPGTYVNASTYSVSSLGVITLGGGAINTVTQSAATFVVNDLYTFNCVTAGASNSDVNAAFTALLTTYASTQWGVGHLVLMPASAAAAASLAAVVDTQLATAFAGFKYVRFLTECPTLGTIIVSGSAAIPDTADTDSIVSAAFTSFSSTHGRTGVCAGDCDLVSSVSGRQARRCASWPIAARLALVPPAEDGARVARGALTSVTKLYRDESATPFLDAARINTLRSYIGLSGFFVSGTLNGPGVKSMAQVTSDFYRFAGGRVMDAACTIARAASLQYVQSNVRVNKSSGRIDERDAKAIEETITAKLRDGLVSTSPPNATDAVCLVDRTNNILSTGQLNLKIRVTPLGYVGGVAVDIGFFNPALAAAA